MMIIVILVPYLRFFPYILLILAFVCICRSTIKFLRDPMSSVSTAVNLRRTTLSSLATSERYRAFIMGKSSYRLC